MIVADVKPRGEPGTQEPALRLGWFERWLDETHFLERFPHYTGVISRMDPIATRVVSTMAVAMRRWDDPGGRLQLFVNTDYFRKNPQHRAGILLHEIQHVVLGHLENLNLHHVGHPRIMEIAMELSANEFVDPEEVPGGIHIPMFEQFGVKFGQSTMERYAILAEAHECGAIELLDWWSSSMLDVHRPGRCRAGGSGIGDFLDARSDGATPRNWNRGWGLGAPTIPDEIERMKRAIQVHLGGERGGEDGSQPGRQRMAKEIDRVILGSRTSPHRVLDWRRILASAFPRRRLIQPDYKKPNRRFLTRIGEIPGRTRRPPKPRLLVGLDTSGSMTADTLARVAREVTELGRHARVTVVECDAAAHRVYPLVTQLLGPFLGGGDTDFEPVFDRAEHGPQSHELDGIVYFTDGRGEMPGTSRLPTLWAITHEDPFLPPFGKVVRVL